MARHTLFFVVLAILISQPGLTRADTPPQTLTPQIYRERCLFCHQSFTPEGIDPSVLGNIPPNYRLKPADMVAFMQCQRRCENCGPPPQNDKPAEGGKK